MAEAQSTGRDTLPKLGRVNEVCREWLIREDGALAYRLQNEEISEHLSGNKFRNAQVREDFPCALDEQIREQRLAEQAAALYHQMIIEQEEQDALVAKQLADKIDKEEQAKKKAIEQEDAEIARQLLERERLKQLDRQHRVLTHQTLQTQAASSSSSATASSHRSQNIEQQHSPRKNDYYESPRTVVEHSEYRHESPKRQGYLMPLPNQIQHQQQLQQPLQQQQQQKHRQSPSKHVQQQQQQQQVAHFRTSSDDLFNNFQQCSIADALDLGLPVDEIDEKRIQEERDAELARKLQEQEGCSAEEAQLIRDRLIAIEAQDKEFAKALQEKERAKVRRAKERAKQKALAKKQQEQQQLQQQQQQQLELGTDQILTDDSYQNPVDLLQQPECSYNSNHHPHNPYAPNCRLTSLQQQQQQQQQQQHQLQYQANNNDDDVNYSYPVDMLLQPSAKVPYEHSLKQNCSPQKNYDPRLNSYRGNINGGGSDIRTGTVAAATTTTTTTPPPSANGGTNLSPTLPPLPVDRDRDSVPAVRPTQLDLKSSFTRGMKPRSPDPDSIDICDPIQPDSNGYAQHANIAMAIDPTYTRRSISQTPSSQDTSATMSSSSTTTTTSSTTSPAISLPPPDISEDELSPVPPYMPIQGQRRTASLEKKKKRAKDGCKQQ